MDYTVSVVVLATDETESLKKTVDYIAQVCVHRPDRIIVVLSRKATADCVQTCKALQGRYGDFLTVAVQQKDGLGAAVRFGIDCVQTSHMIFFPADMAIEVESIDKMISLSQANPKAVIKTSRWLQKGSFEGYGKLRFVLNRAAQSFLRVLLFSRLTDLTNPVQVIPIDYQKKIRWREDDFRILIEQTIVPVRLGYEIKEVPARCFARNEGSSKNSAIQTALYLTTALRVRFTPKNKLYK